MSGIEIGIAVIGAVAALITAYQDAGSILQNIKEKRKAKGALPPTFELEESIKEGHEEIEKIAAKGVRRFGTDFEQGDDIAHRALQALTIEVQASFLRHLTEASKNDNFIDFEPCIDVAISSRLKAVNILNELYLRQQQNSSSASIRSEPEKIVTTSSSASLKGEGSLRNEPSPSLKLDPSSTKSETPSEKGDVSPRPLSRRTSSWNPFKNRRRSSLERPEKEVVSQPRQIVRTSSSVVSSPTLSPSPGGSYSSSTMSGLHMSLLTPPITPSTTMSTADILMSAGFCKGALYIQQGLYEKGVQVSMKNMEWACHCRKCSFITPADRDEKGRPRFDDKVYEASKLQFRSLLLFKSHIGISHKKQRVYRCLICVLGGDTSAVYDGEHHLFEHISRHQGGAVDGVDLVGAICLGPEGAQVGNQDTFDVFFPQPPSQAGSRQSRHVAELEGKVILEADGMELVEADSNQLPDEMFVNNWADAVRR